MSVNGHDDPKVCDGHCVYSSTTSDALNDGLHERPWKEETVLDQHGASMDNYW